MTLVLLWLAACTPGEGVLLEPGATATTGPVVITPAAPGSTTGPAVTVDTGLGVALDTGDALPPVDTGAPVTGAGPCQGGACAWSLALEASLPPGPTRGAIGAAVDAAGVVHVVVHDPADARLLYLRSDARDVEGVFGGAGDADATELSVAVDVDGRLHVATFAQGTYRFVTREPDGTWGQASVPGRADDGVVTTAAVSRRGDTWMGVGDDVFVWSGGAYVAKPSPGAAVEALALDARGVAHAAVGTGSSEAVYTRFESAAWTARVTLHEGTFQRTRLAIDDGDVGHAVVELANGAGSDLLYADTRAGSWALTSLAVGAAAHASGIAVDAGAVPHVSYHDGVGAVVHGWFDGATWVRSEVGPASDVQETIPLIDPVTGQPVVVYYDTTYDRLRVYRGG